MKNQKINSTLFYIAVALFYIAAIICLAGGNHHSVGIVWLCLGSTFLCLGTSSSRKSSENEEKQDNEKRDHQ